MNSLFYEIRFFYDLKKILQVKKTFKNNFVHLLTIKRNADVQGTHLTHPHFYIKHSGLRILLSK